MTSYAGRHAQLYDVFYAAKDYESEARFVHECLGRHAEGPETRVLDLACGTGRHAIALERLGHQVVGIDHSESMLEVARTNALAANARVEFRLGDLRSLAVAGAPFDAAVCLFDAIGYVATNDALAQAFEGVRRSLRPGGLFVFDFWHAAAMLREYEPVRVRRWEVPEGELVRISETALDCERQLAHVRYTVHEHRRDGTWSSFQETQSNRYFLVQEMAHWLSASGFAPLAWHDGYSLQNRISETTWHVLAVARLLKGGG